MKQSLAAGKDRQFLNLNKHKMKNLITLTEAQTLVAGSEERKQELIRLVNAEITSQAERGLRWSHLPSSASEIERQWLKDELCLHGFKVLEGHPAINW